MKLYEKNSFLRESDVLSNAEKDYYERMAGNMSEEDAPLALYQLSDYLCRYYGKKVIILLDEYDTPMQEAYVGGFWDELVSFTRSLFNSTFKTNPYMARAVMTGITRVSKESIFSDLNNLKDVVVIMILPYDLFGKNRMMYTFRTSCVEDTSIPYDDGVTTIFLYTEGEEGIPSVAFSK